ncbi:uncharacterized protein LOC132952957 isoform X2 [Metopolophium dirhodum]|nr:uncharacterized protein LOC132952957 isoform X2 [Metopolophium dirhodum]
MDMISDEKKKSEISYLLARLDSNTVTLSRVCIEKYGNPYLRILMDHILFDFNDNITLTSTDQNSLTSYSLSLFRGMNFNLVKVGK